MSRDGQPKVVCHAGRRQRDWHRSKRRGAITDAERGGGGRRSVPHSAFLLVWDVSRILPLSLAGDLVPEIPLRGGLRCSGSVSRGCAHGRRGEQTTEAHCIKYLPAGAELHGLDSAEPTARFNSSAMTEIEHEGLISREGADKSNACGLATGTYTRRYSNCIHT